MHRGVLALAIALAGMALGACSAPPRPLALQSDAPVVHLRVEGFSDYDKAKVLRAVNEWNATGFAHFEIDSGEASTKFRARNADRIGAAVHGDLANAWTIENSRAWLAVAAVTFWPTNSILVFASNRCELTGVIRHELGHLLGLGHSTHGLMSPTCAHGAYSGIDGDTLVTLAAEQKARGRPTP